MFTHSNDIVILPTGEVSFLHLTRELLPLYESLGGSLTTYPPPARPPNHLSARQMRTDLQRDELPVLPEAALWAAHAQPSATASGATLLELKCELARRLLNPCRLCARRCPVDRRSQPGWCQLVGEESELFGVVEHYGEEPPLVPSLTVYLSGCNYRCKGCQTGADFDGLLQRQRLPPAALAAHIDTAYGQGIWNVNFLGGEPSLHLPYVLLTVAACQQPVFVVWNSNMHLTPEVLALLDGVVDFYLADLKYGNDGCARKVARITPYWSVVTAAIEAAMRQPAEVIVRTLPLPGHEHCCTEPIEAYLALLGVRITRQTFQAQPARAFTRRIAASASPE
jgi:uncharacterized Fe-S radical SAM superfamily protein PflX